MSYRQAEEYLFSRRRMGMKYGLERIEALLHDLGNPERSFETIHVVGSNGKGSTAAMLAATGTALGLPTGLLTSPHLLCFRERIALDGKWMPEDYVADFVSGYRELIEEHRATFFEITTALGACYFRDMGAAWVIAEAGLGGRLDATRMLPGRGTVFTSVTLEHSRILGETAGEIASEKVAIAEPGTILVASQQDPPVESRILERAGSAGLEIIGPDPAPCIPFEGGFQGLNAALAWTAARRLLEEDAEVLDRAFRAACERLYLPGRLDLRKGEPSILFDVAHNPPAVEQLCSHIRGWKRPVPAVVGFLADKKYRQMLLIMAQYCGPFVATTPLNERKLEASELASELATMGLEHQVRDSIPEAVDYGRTLALQSNRRLVVAGSFFVTGEAMLASWRNGWIEEPPSADIRAVIDG